jgi:type IV pilus assembly protein PilW
MSRRGFTLLELMIASAISLGVLAGGMLVTTQLQRRAVLESRTAATQGSLRALQEVLAPEFERAGSGTGTGRLTFGNADRYAIDVKTNEAFASDSTFALPPAAYSSGGANLASDFVEIWTADTGRALSVVRCPSNKTRQNGFICTSADWPSAMVGKNIFAVNPSKRRGCIFEVKSVSGGPSAHAVLVDDAHKVPAAPAAGLCDEGYLSNPNPDVLAFWDSDELLLIPTSSRAFRVNWKSGGPVLEVDPDGTTEDGFGWQTLAPGVEQMKVRFGLMDPLSPTPSLTWHPDPAASRLAIDACPKDGTTTPPAGCAIPGATTFNTALDEASIRDALMHRVRNVEVLFTSRSGVPDIDRIKKSGSGFALDEEANRRDGYKRRSFVIRVTPRNFAYLRN